MDVSFNIDDLLAEASAECGLDNFGDPHFREGLEVLLETMDRHLADDRIRARHRSTVIRRLVTRLEIQQAFQQHPEILDQKIERPMFVTGLPRSGTSALFNLLNSDPDTRGLLLWETVFPQPLKGLAAGQPDPRKAALAEKMEASRNPEFEKIHFSSAVTPEECCLLQVYSFDGVHTGWEYLLEPYHSWFRSHGLAFMYREHRDHLKLLQWQRPGTRWLLKSPAHMWAIEEIVAVFPDVSLVWGHRDPVAVTASICSMTEMVNNMSLGPTTQEVLTLLGPVVMDWYASSLERGLQARKSIAGDRVLDYSFKEFVADPRQTVESIYEHFQLPIVDATRLAIDRHIRDNKKGKHGEHRYDLAKFGLEQEQVRQRYDFYLDNPLL